MRLDQDNTRRLLPVFVFDMALQEPLLLDGWRQSVAFEDMVIVVRSSVATYTTYFQCNHGHVDIDLRELTRPILAGVAQSAWGVADTALHYSHGAGRDWNYLWSAGSTPFSPISAMATYSFVQVRCCCGRPARTCTRTWLWCQMGGVAPAGGMCQWQLVMHQVYPCIWSKDCSAPAVLQVAPHARVQALSMRAPAQCANITPPPHAVPAMHPQVDAARRNLVLSSLNHSVAYVSMLLQDLDKLSGDGTAKSALPPEAARTFRQRINMIRWAGRGLQVAALPGMCTTSA